VYVRGKKILALRNATLSVQGCSHPCSERQLQVADKERMISNKKLKKVMLVFSRDAFNMILVYENLT
jgi:hypothetical protein